MWGWLDFSALRPHSPRWPYPPPFQTDFRKAVFPKNLSALHKQNEKPKTEIYFSDF
jgi:hypothetical protein